MIFPSDYDPAHSGLWQTAFGRMGSSRNKKNRLAQLYEGLLLDLRKKAGHLIERVRSDNPELTIHNLTHLDAIWELASQIAGSGYPLTPAEGFVLGAAILLHDAAMCIPAFPGGVHEISTTPEWRDSVSMFIRLREDRLPSPEEIHSPSEEVRRIALPQVLRTLHSAQSEKLPKMSWRNAQGQDEYLIENTEVRNFYSSVIGKIARSHGEPIEYLEANFRQSLGSCPAFDGGPVDALKLACLLRCGDAAHIDARRAPSFAEAISRPTGIASLHWNFQHHLAKAQVVAEALVYTASSAFTLEEADAWWLCFDSVRTVDRELRASDALLEVESRDRFVSRHVRGADSPAVLVRDIPTDGWDPIDAHIKVSDVRQLVRMFGGEKLYGNNNFIVLRELLQNAADAIRARRTRTSTLDDYKGEIRIGLHDDEEGTWFTISDDGIGMSGRTMVGSLLDFGTSFWSSAAVQSEFPGLMSSGFVPVGRYGIGFFSVFMVADTVRVSSRRFDDSQAEVRTLEFRSGLSLRPILRRAEHGELIPSTGGTTIRLKLRVDARQKGGLLYVDREYERSGSVSLRRLAASLCPNLDVNIWLLGETGRERVIRGNDWKSMDSEQYLSRVHGAEAKGKDTTYAALIRPVKYKGRVIGRACIRADAYYEKRGRITANGFATQPIQYIDGTLEGEVQNLARDEAKVVVPGDAMARWAEEQAHLISLSNLPEKEQMECAGVVIGLGGNPGDLPIAQFRGEFLSIRELGEAVSKAGLRELLVVHGVPSYDDDECHPRDFGYFRAYANVFILGSLPQSTYQDFWWGNKASYWPSLLTALTHSNGIWKENEDVEPVQVIGEANQFEISRPVTVLTKQMNRSKHNTKRFIPRTKGRVGRAPGKPK